MTPQKLRVGVIGATGLVGQKLITSLHHHPWFELAAVAASPASAGRVYGETVKWLEPEPIPEAAAALSLQPPQPGLGCDLVLSAIPGAEARVVEPEFAAAGYPVVSNASALRMEPNVPLVVPEVNPEHLGLLDGQGPGWVVTNPNCATVGLVMTLKPLADAFGLEDVSVTTMQAVSGAGYPGQPALDILGNVLPHIPGEEDKLETEPQKILGRLTHRQFEPLGFAVSAQCNRVPVRDGHLLSVSVRLGSHASLDEVHACFSDFRGSEESRDLPSSPERRLQVLDGARDPQPARHRDLGKGMTVSVGQLRTCPVLDVRFVALVHNTRRGAAGAALLNAELLVRLGRLGSDLEATGGRT